MRKQFNIPLPSHVKKWIVKDIFNDINPPFKVDEDSLIGRHVASVLLDPRREEFVIKAIELNDSLPLVLSDELAGKRPTIKKLTAINLYLEKAFKQSIISWVKAMRVAGIRPYNSVQHFLDYYKIAEEEYKHESAYKFWIRYNNSDYKKKKKLNKSLTQKNTQTQ